MPNSLSRDLQDRFAALLAETTASPRPREPQPPAEGSASAELDHQLERYRSSMVRLAASIVGPGGAEDVVQDAFFAVSRTRNIDFTRLRGLLIFVTRQKAFEQVGRRKKRHETRLPDES